MSDPVQTPQQIAAEIVDRFSWGSNVVHEGRLVGQQYVVAIAIAEAIKLERMRLRAAKDALCEATMVLNGVTAGRLKPAGRRAVAARQTVHAAFDAAYPACRGL